MARRHLAVYQRRQWCGLKYSHIVIGRRFVRTWSGCLNCLQVDGRAFDCKGRELLFQTVKLSSRHRAGAALQTGGNTPGSGRPRLRCAGEFLSSAQGWGRSRPFGQATTPRQSAQGRTLPPRPPGSVRSYGANSNRIAAQWNCLAASSFSATNFTLSRIDGSRHSNIDKGPCGNKRLPTARSGSNLSLIVARRLFDAVHNDGIEGAFLGWSLSPNFWIA